MAGYIFESAQQSDVNNFTASDFLFFFSGNANDVVVTHTDSGALLNEATTLSKGGHTLTFAAEELSGASHDGHLVFQDSTNTLMVGANSDNNIDLSDSATEGHSARAYGFGGVDTIYGSDASDTIDGGAGDDRISGQTGSGTDANLGSEQDYLYGGLGNDSINGNVGNEHIYGNNITTVAGADDGDDTIHAGGGKDYVQGNAGDDQIFGEAGADRLYGGADNDTIDGGDDNDYLQGNKGLDSLSGGDGIDEIHGGADNDTLHGNAGNDALFGDLGNDTVYGDTGYDKLTGGAGNDTFAFNAGDASIANATSASTAAGHGVTDQIVDYVDGTDKIFLSATFTSVLHPSAGVGATTIEGALSYAQDLMDAHAGNGEIAAVSVGSDTYLFYNDAAGATINQVIKVLGVADSVFTTTDFTHA